MRAVGLTEFGGPEVLRVIELPDPVPGMDAAGVVDAIGPGTDTPLRPGDPVIAIVSAYGPRGGAYAELVVAPAESVVPIPSNVAFPGRFHAADERPHSPGRAGPADRARRSDCCGDRIGGGLRRVCGADGQERRAALLDQRELRG